MHRIRRAKIVATLGPASADLDMIRDCGFTVWGSGDATAAATLPPTHPRTRGAGTPAPANA